MEVESWFLAEHTLFEKINPILTTDYIKENILYKGNGIDLLNDDPEEIYENPATILKRIYELVELKYKKRKDDSHKITGNLDYNHLYEITEEGLKIKSLKQLFYALDLSDQPSESEES